jgi:hypothetical protein
MRKTQEAEQQFRFCSNRALTEFEKPNSGETAYFVNLANGLQFMAAALRDVYDKLNAMDGKLDVIVRDLAHRPGGRI